MHSKIEMSTPIFPPDKSNLSAWVKEGQWLTAKPSAALPFTQGKAYHVRFAPVYFNTGRHEGKDDAICLTDDAGQVHSFCQRPALRFNEYIHPMSELWLSFYPPIVTDIDVYHFDLVEANRAVMQSIAAAGGFQYYPAQRDFFARMAVKDFGLVASEVGTGKTLCAITLHYCKQSKRTLIIAPAGTVQGPSAHWQKEIARFAPALKVWPLFNYNDYLDALMANGGVLPDGIYLTYPQAYLTNGRAKRKPLRDQCAGAFDLVVADEAQAFKNIRSGLTQEFLQIQSKCRFCMTATPIHDTASDLFPLLQWLCPELLPFNNRLEFDNYFLCKDASYHQHTYVIARPAQLAKLLAPYMGVITKEDCNEAMPKVNVHVNYIDMDGGTADFYRKCEAEEYSRNAKVSGGIRSSVLRQVCTAPSLTPYHEGFIRDDLTPKNQAIVAKLADIVAEGRQAVFICARRGQTDIVRDALAKRGIAAARIDGTIPNKLHAQAAADFKAGRFPVMLMGIKCAMGYSFDQCRDLVIGSIEWSPGTWTQAVGRVWRVTSRAEVNVHAFLTSLSIECEMFSRLMEKQDNARLVAA